MFMYAHKCVGVQRQEGGIEKFHGAGVQAVINCLV